MRELSLDRADRVFWNYFGRNAWQSAETRARSPLFCSWVYKEYKGGEMGMVRTTCIRGTMRQVVRISTFVRALLRSLGPYELDGVDRTSLLAQSAANTGFGIIEACDGFIVHFTHGKGLEGANR